MNLTTDRINTSPIKHYFNTLEFAITDFCNLKCKSCSQGTQFQKDKKHMSVDYLRGISKFIRSHEFNTIKISGGEPTLHPEFGKICEELRELFPAKKYILATNGYLLNQYLHKINVFDLIEFSNYPTKNDEIYRELCKLDIPIIDIKIKEEYSDLTDISLKKNINKHDVFRNCGSPRRIAKVIQDRIYPCCISFGLAAIRGNIDLDDVSVILDENWRQNIPKLDLENYCKECFYNVKIHNKFSQYLNLPIIFHEIRDQFSNSRFFNFTLYAISAIHFYFKNKRRSL
ncbi:MAG: radical SAM protein [Candidatus Tenebribacter burtonii]|nr:radical SAM protein [Candidatus Tenebribacter burtonii]